MPTARISRIRSVLVITMLANLAVASIKLVLGLLSGSLSLLADAFHSFFDSASNIIGLLGITVSAKPPDENHPYGHKKFETLASMGISVMLGIAALEILRGVVSRLLNPRPIHVSWIVLFALMLTMVVNLLVSLYEQRKGRQLESEILIADSFHTRSDFFAALLVLISLICYRLDLRFVDPVAALVIVVLIARAAYKIVSGAVATLTDAARVDVGAAERYINAIEGVAECHNLRTRGVSGEVFMDMHLRIDPGMTVERVHELEHEVIESIHERFPEVRDVMIHFEPQQEAKTSV